jgi:hypothetical protein
MKKEMMKGMLLIMLAEIFFLAAIVVLKSDVTWAKPGEASSFKRLKTMKTYHYGPRGKISTASGKQLVPAYPASFPRSI